MSTLTSPLSTNNSWISNLEFISQGTTATAEYQIAKQKNSYSIVPISTVCVLVTITIIALSIVTALMFHHLASISSVAIIIPGGILTIAALKKRYDSKSFKFAESDLRNIYSSIVKGMLLCRVDLLEHLSTQFEQHAKELLTEKTVDTFLLNACSIYIKKENSYGFPYAKIQKLAKAALDKELICSKATKDVFRTACRTILETGARDVLLIDGQSATGTVEVTEEEAKTYTSCYYIHNLTGLFSTETVSQPTETTPQPTETTPQPTETKRQPITRNSSQVSILKQKIENQRTGLPIGPVSSAAFDSKAGNVGNIKTPVLNRKASAQTLTDQKESDS